MIYDPGTIPSDRHYTLQEVFPNHNIFVIMIQLGFQPGKNKIPLRIYNKYSLDEEKAMVNNTNNLQLRKQKETIAQLNKLVAALKDTIAALNRREEEITSERDDLKEQVEYLSKKLYGSPNTKRSSASNNIPGQLSLFDKDDGL